MEREERKEQDRKRRIRNIIIQALIVLACFIWLLLAITKTSKEEKRVSTWVQVACTVENMKIYVDPMANPASFYWIISYKYQYEAKEYVSDKYNIVNKYKHIGGHEEKKIAAARKEKRKIPEPYSVGDKTVCFVNPDMPSESVLVREIKGKEIFVFRLLGPVVLSIGFLIVLLHSIWDHFFCDD